MRPSRQPVDLSLCGPLCGPLVQSTTRLSVFYFLVFIGMGLILANLGPVMPALIARLHVEVAVMGYIVAARALGYLLGCVLAGPMYDQYAASGNKLLSAGVVFAGLLNAATDSLRDLASRIGEAHEDAMRGVAAKRAGELSHTHGGTIRALGLNR